ncbi:MAG: MSCRAMM family adhesin SdrC [Clostridiales bacterium]|jgi:hypothetical protein|nr:MSCRAMM family adhesin SdrC [Clostridiales bacterium]
MGQQFFLSLYEDSTKKYSHIDFMFGKLGEIASNNERWVWGYILNRPLRVGFIGDASDRYYNEENEEDYDNEEDCDNDNEEDCDTDNEEDCDTDNEEDCNTDNEEDCDTDNEEDCDTDNEEDCDTDNEDYGVASELPSFESDCAGELELGETTSDVGWTGYLINHTKQVYFDVSAYYEASRIGDYSLDPLPILTASGHAASLFWEGFSNGTAFSLLGSWFTDVIEWSKTRPADMDELKDLEFMEIYPFDFHRIWGVTPDNYLADRKGQTFYSRKDIGLFFISISPGKIKHLVIEDDKRISIQTELIPDPGVALKHDGKSVSFLDEDGNKFEGFRHEWFGNAYILDRHGNKISCDEWLHSRPRTSA